MSYSGNDDLRSLKISKQKYPIHKKLQPQSLLPDPALPSIEEFELSQILSNELSSESSQVVEDIMNVAKNYRKDLQSTIKHKLMVEQKLQSKNTEIVKVIKSTIKISTRRRSKIKNVLNEKNKPASKTGNNVDQLLDLSFNASASVESSTKRFERIMKALESRPGDSTEPFLDKERFPVLYNVLNPKENVSDGPSDPTETEIQSAHSPHSPQPTEKFNESAPDNPSPSVEEIIKAGAEIIEDDSRTNTAYVDHDLSSPAGFEEFMASSISKYRRLQQTRRESYSIFDETESFHDAKQEIEDDTEETEENLKNTFHVTDDPLSLIYAKSSHGIFPNYSPSGKGKYSVLNSMGIAKAPATVKSSSLVTHFKKLRINGPPTATYHSKNVKKDSLNTDEVIKYSANSSEHYLVDTLDRIKNLADDSNFSFNKVLWNDDNDKMPDSMKMMSAQSTSSQNMDNPTNSRESPTDHHVASEQQSVDSFEKSSSSSYKESTPTPKFEPSHYKLNPKKSILKIDKTKESLAKVNDNHTRKESIGSDMYSAQIPPTSNSVSESVTPVVASGTIISSETSPPVPVNHDGSTGRDDPDESANPDECDTHSIKSIPKLRTILDWNMY